MDIDSVRNPDEFPGISPAIHAQVSEAREIWRMVYLRRGQYLSEFNSCEPALKIGIARYFGVGADKVSGDEEFNVWVMGRFGTRDLIELAKQCIESIGLESEFEEFFSLLNRGLMFRHSIAHSHVDDQIDLMAEFTIEKAVAGLLNPASIRVTRKQRVVTENLLEELDIERAALAPVRDGFWWIKFNAAMSRTFDLETLRGMFAQLDQGPEPGRTKLDD